MLDRWRYLTSIMYPNRPELMTRTIQANELTIDKLVDVGWVMTDNLNAAGKYLRLLVESIKHIAEEEGITKEKIKLFKAGKVITNLYMIFFSDLTLHDLNFFTITLFCRLLTTSTQCLLRSCHKKSWRASVGLDENGSEADTFLSAHHHRNHQSPTCC